MITELAIAGGALLFGNRVYQRIQNRNVYVKKLLPEPLSFPSQEQIIAQPEYHVARDIHKNPDAEQIMNTAVVMSSASLGAAIVGALFFPPIAILSVPYILMVVVQLWQDAYKSLKKGVIGVSFITGLTMLSCVGLGYYVPASLSAFLFALSRKYLLSIKDNSQKEFIDVFQQQPKSVWLYQDGMEIETDFELLQEGDIVVAHTGEMIPVDGTIVEGIASVDQRLLTGEAQPIEKELGDTVFASTVVLSGEIQIQVEKAGADTTIAQIGEILNQTVNFKADMQLRAEELADRTVVPILAASAITWPLLGPIPAMAVLNSHTGYRMSLIAPLGILSFFKILSNRGILVKDGHVLDRMPLVDTVVFDKTGTLTLEQPNIRAIHSCSQYTEEQILSYAATAEGKQRHPIALAIVDEARARGIPLLEIDAAEYEVGYGLKVNIVVDIGRDDAPKIGNLDDEAADATSVQPKRQLVRVGSNRFIEKEDIAIPQEIHNIQEGCHEQGHSLVMIAIGDELAGAIELQPTIRPEAKEVVEGLRERGIQSTYIISGDNETPTRKLAQELGIDHYFAETLPQNKAELIEQLQEEGKVICYIGDGINDSIALTKADVSISLGDASTIAQDAAQIVLLRGGLTELCSLFDVAHEYEQNMRSSFWAVVAPCLLCIGGVYFIHFGLVSTILIKQVGLFTGIATALSPLRTHRDELAEAQNDNPIETKTIEAA
ncbi:MAG: heavy metal translocating P-type ATPase [Chloroflexota bacterium]